MTALIRAAGGVIWNGDRIAIVYRDRYQDWGLPKGKLEAGESFLEGALREVREETGLTPRLAGFAGSDEYDKDGVPKVVIYWHMILPGEPPPFEPNDEVKELRWSTVAEAKGLVAFPEVLDRLEQTRPAPDTTAPSPLPESTLVHAHRAQLRSSARRLAQQLVEIESSLLDTRRRSPGGDDRWFATACEFLNRADHALGRNQVEAGWILVNQVERLHLRGLARVGPEALRAQAEVYYAEAQRKLGKWRRAALTGIIGEQDGERLPLTLVAAETTLALLQEHHKNTWRKQTAMLKQLWNLGLISVLAFTGSLVLLATTPAMATGATVLGTWELLLTAALFGVLGATLSAMSRMAPSMKDQRVPDTQLSGWMTLARIVAGGVSALVALAFLESGLLPLMPTTPSLALVVAFASGFSERLLGRAVERLTG